MTPDEAITSFANWDASSIAAMQWALDQWDTAGPPCRTLLHDYVQGADLSERTERALYVIIHILGEKADTPSFADLCRLAMDAERCSSVLGDDAMIDALSRVLISTFDGNVDALRRLVEAPDVDGLVRANVLLVLAYLTRTGRLSEKTMYDYLAGLPDRLLPVEEDFVWFGWVRAVAALGFAGLSGRADKILRSDWVDPQFMSAEDFWAELKESQEDPHGTSGKAWDNMAPMGKAIDFLGYLADPLDHPAAPVSEPIRNVLRHVGRNDPCPCGSGKKYKKCCLAA